jgi:hypothetical protein
VQRPTFFSFACAWAQHSTSSPFASLPLSLSRCIEISLFLFCHHYIFILVQNGFNFILLSSWLKMDVAMVLEGVGSL